MERHIVQEKAQKKTALIITPPESVWPAIQQIRSQHDQKASTVWMPHIKLLFPFVDEDLFKVPKYFPTGSVLISFLLALVINHPICIINNSTFYQYTLAFSFVWVSSEIVVTVSLDRADYLEHSKKAFTLVLKPASKANSDLVRLQRALENAFPQCDDISARFGTFNPHLTIGQFQDRVRNKNFLEEIY